MTSLEQDSETKKVLLFSHSLLSNYLQPNGLQHASLACPSLSTWVWSNSCALSWWYHPTSSPSVIPFSSCPQSFPESGSFLMSLFFTLSSQSIGASFSASVLPMNIQSWFPLGLTALMFLHLSFSVKSLLQHHSSKASVLQYSTFFMVQLSHLAFFFSLGVVLTTSSYMMLWTSVHSSLGTLSDLLPWIFCHFYCIIIRDLI